MIRRQDLARLRAEVERLGGTLGEVFRGGKHLAVPLTYRGQTRRVTLPFSPGDSDWLKVKISDIKRTMREMAA
jgi:hypothetical protein